MVRFCICKETLIDYVFIVRSVVAAEQDFHRGGFGRRKEPCSGPLPAMGLFVAPPERVFSFRGSLKFEQAYGEIGIRTWSTIPFRYGHNRTSQLTGGKPTGCSSRSVK